MNGRSTEVDQVGRRDAIVLSATGSTGRLILAAVVALASAAAANGQLLARLTNPEIEVEIAHPPELNIQVDTVVFGNASGACAEEVTQALVDDFLGAGLEVVDREHLGAILVEHDLASRGLTDPATVLAVGKVIGPSALVSVRGTRCDSERDMSTGVTTKRMAVGTTTDEDGNKTTKYENREVSVRTARTSVDLRVSVRVVDLTTGRVFAGRSFASSPALTRSMELQGVFDESEPAYPLESAVMDVAVGSVLAEARRMFFGWTESRPVVFYNNDRCGLKAAYRALEVGDQERALDLSIQNLDSCRNDRRAKKRVLANAYYNLGMVQAIRGDYEDSLANLAEAERLRPGTIVVEAMSETRAARAASEEVRKFNEETESLVEAREFFLAERAETEREAAAAEAARALTNADIVEMVEAELPDAVIVARIENAVANFSLKTDDLKALSDAGVSETVIVAMISARTE